MFLHEYHVTPRQVFHDFTPTQLRLLSEKIQQRRLREKRDLVAITHGDPKKLTREIDKSLIRRPAEAVAIQKISEQDLSLLNIRTKKVVTT